MARKMAPKEERLSEVAGEFFLEQDPRDRERLRELLEFVSTDPEVDEESVFELETDSATWHVLVDDDYTVYFRPERDVIYIDSIQETPEDVRRSAAVARAIGATASQRASSKMAPWSRLRS